MSRGGGGGVKTPGHRWEKRPGRGAGEERAGGGGGWVCECGLWGGGGGGGEGGVKTPGQS